MRSFAHHPAQAHPEDAQLHGTDGARYVARTTPRTERVPRPSTPIARYVRRRCRCSRLEPRCSSGCSRSRRLGIGHRTALDPSRHHPTRHDASLQPWPMRSSGRGLHGAVAADSRTRTLLGDRPGTTGPTPRRASATRCGGQASTDLSSEHPRARSPQLDGASNRRTGDASGSVRLRRCRFTDPGRCVDRPSSGLRRRIRRCAVRSRTVGGRAREALTSRRRCRTGSEVRRDAALGDAPGDEGVELVARWPDRSAAARRRRAAPSRAGSPCRGTCGEPASSQVS